MGTIREQFTTPVGRLVQGDCFEPQTKDQQGNLRVVKTGPNMGQPSPQFFIALAIPKITPNTQTGQLENNPEWPVFMGLLDRIARQEWPALFPATPPVPTFGVMVPACANNRFAFKVKDGDGIDTNGKPNADKEGFAGHWVVSFASAYAPKIVRPTSPGVWETITDPKLVKRGYYGRVAGSTTGNDNVQNPGLYLNLDMFELLGHGVEIVGGPDAASAFGAPAALPPGASAVPVGGAAMPPAVPSAAAPAPAPAAPAPAPAAPAPAPAAPAPAPPVVPDASFVPAPVMTPAANGLTREQYHASGWTDAQLIAQGFMIA